MKINTRHIALIAALLLIADRGLAGTGAVSAVAATVPPAVIASPAPTAGNSYTDGTDGGHAIHADGVRDYYSNVTVSKTGNAELCADLSGENAAVLAENGAELELREVSVTGDGTHADAVFSLGEGTTVHIANSTVKTFGGFSAGLTSADGGELNAYNLVVRTAGVDSPAIRSGGSIHVSGGTYDVTGAGSPAIHASADAVISNAELSAAAAQAVVMDGSAAVTLENVSLKANHTDSAEDDGGSARYQAVLIQQPAPDGGEEAVTFTMRGGSLTNLHGDVFLVSGASAVINLTGAAIVNDDPEGVFLRVAAGKNGSHTELYTASQTIEGDVLTDERSTLAIHLWDGSSLTGAVNPTDEGEVSVELTDGATWTLTGDSHIKSLTCQANSIRLNGFTLFIDGEVYAKGIAR